MAKYSETGGKWLGIARKWMQSNFINGSIVTWGSDDVLKSNKNITPKIVEDLAARIASAVDKDIDTYKEKEKTLLKKVWSLEMEVERLKKNVDKAKRFAEEARTMYSDCLLEKIALEEELGIKLEDNS